MDRTRSRASVEQFITILEFMERHGDLARPQQGAQGRVRSDGLWQELTLILNAMGGGDQKPIDKWKKVWADWKTKTKKKALLIRQHANATGGGPNSRLTLNAFEERVVAILGLSAVEGQADIAEHGLNCLIPPPPAPLHSTSPPAINLQIEDVNENAHTTQSSSPPLAPAPVVVTSPLPAPTTPPPSTSRQQPPAAVPSPHSSAASPRRRLQQRARRRRALTPFDRAASEFVAIEQRRLQFEELRERQLHERETQIIEVLRRLTDIAQTWMERSTSRDNS